jgi:NAD(P)-dependent dehydrogenase (short-subunit alcohol dehydrogenase family)
MMAAAMNLALADYTRKVNSNRTLSGKIAVVAGSSRGCGRGIALALGDAGATVFVTGRTTRGGPKPVDQAPGTIEETAEEVTRRGGIGIAAPVDHTDPAQVEVFFRSVAESHGRLDILACAVWGGNERFLDPVWTKPFWNQPAGVWSEFLDAGPHAFWLSAHAAARSMAERRSGLIVAVTEPITDQFEGQQSSMAEAFGQLAHYSTNRLVAALAREARPAGIAVIGLLPGFMRTERVERHLPDEESRRQFRYDLSESPEYAGRGVAALATDANVLAKSGSLVFVADLADEYGFTDVDGKRVGNFYKVALGLGGTG